jgi:hypothetical protein
MVCIMLCYTLFFMGCIKCVAAVLCILCVTWYIPCYITWYILCCMSSYVTHMIHTMEYTMLCYMICNMLMLLCCQDGHLPPLNANDDSVFSASECLIQDHVKSTRLELQPWRISSRKCSIALTLMCTKFDVRQDMCAKEVTCAGLRTCWVVCQWCSALWLETARPPCPIDLATAKALLPIPALGEATEVGRTSSTSGCGCMGGASHSMSLLQKLSRGIWNERGMLDDGKLLPWSCSWRSVCQRMITVLMIERHMLQMMLKKMKCRLVYNHSEMFYNIKSDMI